jgi:hypothetical protein
MLFAFDEILSVYDTPEWRNSFNEDLKYHMRYLRRYRAGLRQNVFSKNARASRQCEKALPGFAKEVTGRARLIIACVIEGFADGVDLGGTHADALISFLCGDGLVELT